MCILSFNTSLPSAGYELGAVLANEDIRGTETAPNTCLHAVPY